MADNKKNSAKSEAKAAPKGDTLPADEAKGAEAVEPVRAELPLETVKSDGIVTAEQVSPVGSPTAPDAEVADEDAVEFAADQHVEFARKIYRKEPWVVKTVLGDLNSDSLISKADVRERLAVFLGTAVG